MLISSLIQMEVRINGISNEYTSDYPDGWRNKFNDYFKYPVELGGHSLFVKRFEKSPLAFDLLRALKDGYSTVGMPDIYAFKYSKKESCFYLFQEYIAGVEFGQKMEGILSFDLQDYAFQVFKALEFIHVQGFWHTDFTEENLLIGGNKNFYLIDIDSCRPLSVIASSDNIKDASFSASIFANLKRIKPSFEFGDLDGSQINVLQLIFSIIHFYNFTHNRKNEIYSNFTKRKTSNALIALVPFIDQKLKKALDEGLNYNDIEHIVGYLIKERGAKVLLTNQPTDLGGKLVNAIPEKDNHEQLPVLPLAVPVENKEESELKEPIIQALEINGQKRNRISMKHGEEYMLSWIVLNATHIELDGELISIDHRIKYLIADYTKIHQLFAVNRRGDKERRSSLVSLPVKVDQNAKKIADVKAIPNLIYFKVNKNESDFRTVPNSKVTISWHVENVDFVIVNNLRNPPKSQFTRVLDKPYTFTIEAKGLKKKVIRVGLHKTPPILRPKINSFTINNSSQQHITVKSRANCVIAWSTGNVQKVFLYKDGIKIPIDNRDCRNDNYVLKEENKSTEIKTVELKFIAFSKGDSKTEVIRHILLSPQKDRRLVWGLAIAILIVLLLLLFK